MSETANGATFRQQLQRDTAEAGGPAEPHPDEVGSVGKTLFDQPGSTDLTVTVVIPGHSLHTAPAQSLVRVVSRDGRKYLGVVTAGPFAEPDGSLRADSPMLTAVATHGGNYLPPYHGRVQLTILGEELADGALVPPRLRPLPNSPVFVLSDSESGRVLKCDGDVRLGLAAGHEGVVVGVPSRSKAAFPRHTAVLGTTGGGKSTTVGGLVKRAIESGMAVILLDVEGEYTFLHEKTADARMLSALQARGLTAGGVPPDAMDVYHLSGRDTTNPTHPSLHPFALQFGRLSPYAVMEILDLSDAQQERFHKAYDIAKEVMRELGVFPAKNNAAEEQYALELDEFDRGYPKMTVPLLMDVVGACLARAEKGPKEGKGKGKAAEADDDEPTGFEPRSAAFKGTVGRGVLSKRVHAANPVGNAISWRAVLGRLARLNRLKVFTEREDGKDVMRYSRLLKPGRVSVMDLSDTGYSALTNLVIADILAGVQEAQDEAYAKYEAAKQKGETATAPPRVLIVIEEAHEFLSAERIDQMKVLFEQVARIAKRGRKRWLGLCFVTQLPSHLPKQVLGLCNNFLLHKLNDPQVVSMLRRTITGIDDGLWDRLPGLAAGQAIASFPHFTRPLLMSVDPCPAKLRMVD